MKSIRDKKQKGSRNWNKMQLKTAKAYVRLDGLKRDFIEQTTTQLCRDNNIAVEDLTNAKIKMSDKRRRRLIQIAPSGKFVDKLAWKCQKYGTEFTKVDPSYTSKTCSNCGTVNHNLTLKDRTFVCPECGSVLDRDINAAVNIAAKGVCYPFHKLKVVA